MTPRLPHAKVAARCDPADSKPVAAYSGAVPELSIDDRIRNVVRGLVGQLAADDGPEISRDDLRVLEEMALSDEVLSPHQMAAMETTRPAKDFDRFLDNLSPEDVRALRSAIQAVDEAVAPPDGAVPAEPAKNPGPGDAPA